MSFVGTSYPAEQTFTPTVSGYIEKIRVHLGDFKNIKHNYVDSCYSEVSGDYYSYTLEDKGWPLKVTITTSAGVSTEYVSISNPVVQGYTYLTFSGAQNQITPGTTLDLWVETFQFSDREIYETYSTVDVPGIPSSEETITMVLVAAALDLAEAEYGTFVMEASIKVADGDTTYDPTPAISARQARIKFLKDKLEDLTKRDMSRIEGYRIE